MQKLTENFKILFLVLISLIALSMTSFSFYNSGILLLADLFIKIPII